MQLNFGLDTIWKSLRFFSMKCNWISAKTQLGIVLEYFRWEACEFGLRHNLEKSQNNFDEMQWNFGWDTIWNCLRKIPMRCNWILAKTQFGNVSEKFKWGAIEFWLRHSLEKSQNDFDEMQWNFGWDTIWNCLRKNPMRCNWILAQTQFGIVLE